MSNKRCQPISKMEYCVEHDMTTIVKATENAYILLKREHISLPKINSKKKVTKT